MKGMIRAGVMRRPRRLLVRLARVGDSKTGGGAEKTGSLADFVLLANEDEIQALQVSHL